MYNSQPLTLGEAYPKTHHVLSCVGKFTRIVPVLNESLAGAYDGLNDIGYGDMKDNGESATASDNPFRLRIVPDVKISGHSIKS